MLSYEIHARTFHFKQPAGTSRGVYTVRKSYFVTLHDTERPQCKGIGECAPLPRLSCDDIVNYETLLTQFCELLVQTHRLPLALLQPYPGMQFGLETAWTQLHAAGSWRLFDTPFARGEEGLAMNGLVWMGRYDEMLQRLEEKLAQGYRCIKLKIGAIDFADELALLARIRERYTAKQVEIRVDANGAFSAAEALQRLTELAAYDLHSIEQPIRQGQWCAMAQLCKQSPIAIALDEELIGVNTPQMRAALLDAIRPHYLVLKPSLHGGMAGTMEWISLARQRSIGTWMTSALESNVGLNAIAQLCAHVYAPTPAMPQGLGTGQLFTDNVDVPLQVRGDRLWFSDAK